MENPAIDAMVNAAMGATTETPAAAKTVTEPAATENQSDAEGQGNENTDKAPAVKDPWPRSAVNAISRREKKLAKREAEIADYQKKVKEYEEKIARYEPAANKAVDPNDPEPDMAKYNDWNLYQKDLVKWTLRQENKQAAAAKQPTGDASRYTAEEMPVVQQRTQYAVQRIQEITKAHPELVDVIRQSGDALNDLPKETELLLLQSEDPVLAVLALNHDGILDDLGEMGKGLAARTIAAAVARGRELFGTGSAPAQTQTVSAAPAPVSQPRAPSRSAKSGTDLPEAEFRKKYGL